MRYMWKFCTWAALLCIATNKPELVHASEFDNLVDSSEEDQSEESSTVTTKYDPTWSSLDSRPLPTWYDEAKIGIFIHWGVFSVPSLESEWFWRYWVDNNTKVVSYLKENYPKSFTYQDFASQFTAEFYNASEWVDLFARAGVKYVVLTSKHHEGFTNWPSKYSFGWNSMDVGPKRDLVGELANAVRNSSSGIHFGLYHSQFEFFNPLFLQDKDNSFKTDRFAMFKSTPELYELVNAYKPEVIWSDGDGGAPPEFWKAQEFLSWLYNSSPVKDTVVVNDRWGTGTNCKHGGFYNCQDRYNPGTLQKHKWENAFTLDKNSWGFRRNAKLTDYLTIEEVISQVVTSVSCGGNVLINVGPTKDGVIVPIMQERLLQLGAWLGVNGDAIYGTKPWTSAQNDSISSNIWYTTKQEDNKLFAIVLQKWGSNGKLVLGSLGDVQQRDIQHIQLLDFPGKYLSWKLDPSYPAVVVQLPNVRGAIKSNYGFTIVIKFQSRIDP